MPTNDQLQGSAVLSLSKCARGEPTIVSVRFDRRPWELLPPSLGVHLDAFPPILDESPGGAFCWLSRRLVVRQVADEALVEPDCFPFPLSLVALSRISCCLMQYTRLLDDTVVYDIVTHCRQNACNVLFCVDV